jgi:Skp family chaperone for outer membrane proteins
MVTRPSQTVQINNSSLSNASVLFSQMNQKMMSGENHQFQTHQFQHHHHLPYPGFLDLAHVEAAEQESEEEAQMSDDSDASESSNRSRKKRKTNAKRAKKTGEKKSGGVLKRKTCNRWTKKENDMLAKAIQLYGEKKWNDIAKYVGSKNSDQCSKFPSKFCLINRPTLASGSQS